jgi:hypothetical protein
VVGQLAGKTVDGVRFAGARRTVEEQAFFDRHSDALEVWPMLDEAGDIALEEQQGFFGKNELVAEDRAKLVNADRTGASGVLVGLLERNDFAAIRAGALDELL